MRTLFQLATCLILTLCLINTVVAQDNPLLNGQRTELTVTASASSDHVRFAAPSSVVQIRLEVYDSAGRKLLDLEVRGGNVVDWHLKDGQTEPIADDTYLCAVTVKSVSGKLTQRIGSVTFEKGTASVKPIDVSQMTAQQTEAIGPVEENDSLVVLKEDERRTPTVIAHNGVEGQITRGRGALSFRIGDFFRGKDTEQMRLTAEGNLGIGITHPAAKLDVDGLIRSSQGMVFPDGTIQFSAASKTLGARSSKAGQKSGSEQGFQTQATGTGTQNFIAKWTDGAGTLGDSIIFENGGKVGIGTTTPQAGLDYRGSAALFTRDIGVSNPGVPQSVLQLGLTNIGSRIVGIGPSFLFFADNSAGAKSFLGRVSGAWENPTEGAEAGSIRFQVRANSGDTTASTERMRITASGDVGIGTTTPGAKLEVRAGEEGQGGPVEAIRIWGPNLPTSSNSAQDLRWAFAAAGSARLRAYRGGSWDTYLQFLTNHVNQGSDSPQVRMHINHNGNIGIDTTTPQAKLDVRGNIKLGSSGQFFATGGEENLRIVRGYISAGGSIIVGSGFTVTHPGNGIYAITFDTPFSGTPAVTATCEFVQEFGFNVVSTGAVNSNLAVFRVKLNFNDNNAPFFFIAIGPR